MTTNMEVAVQAVSQPKLKASSKEARHEYQRRYYQAHKEEAKVYQRQYNLTHKKKKIGGSRSTTKTPFVREVVRGTFNTDDIMHAPPELAARRINMILSGRRLFTM